MGLNGFIFKKIIKNYAENMKKIVGAFQKLPARQHSQSSPFPPKLGWIGCAIQQANPKRLPGFFFLFYIMFFIYFSKYETIETHASAFLALIISAVVSVLGKHPIWHENKTEVIEPSPLFLPCKKCAFYFKNRPLILFPSVNEPKLVVHAVGLFSCQRYAQEAAKKA